MWSIGKTISRADFDTTAPGLYYLDEPEVFRKGIFNANTGEVFDGWLNKVVRIRQGMGEPLPEGIDLETHVTPEGNLVIVQEGLVQK